MTTFTVARPSAPMSDDQADAVLDLLDSVLADRLQRLRKLAASFNPAGMTCWMRAAVLGLLSVQTCGGPVSSWQDADADLPNIEDLFQCGGQLA